MNEIWTTLGVRQPKSGPHINRKGRDASTKPSPLKVDCGHVAKLGHKRSTYEVSNIPLSLFFFRSVSRPRPSFARFLSRSMKEDSLAGPCLILPILTT